MLPASVVVQWVTARLYPSIFQSSAAFSAHSSFFSAQQYFQCSAAFSALNSNFSTQQLFQRSAAFSALSRFFSTLVNYFQPYRVKIVLNKNALGLGLLYLILLCNLNLHFTDLFKPTSWLHKTSGLIFRNSTFRSQSEFMCFVLIPTQTANSAPHNIIAGLCFFNNCTVHLLLFCTKNQQIHN